MKHLVSLEELYLSENKITKIDGLETLKKLLILDFGYNKIEKLEGISMLPQLEELWVSSFVFASTR